MGRRLGNKQVLHGRWWVALLRCTNGKPDRFLRLGLSGDKWVQGVKQASVFALHGTARSFLLAGIQRIPRLVLYHVGSFPDRPTQTPLGLSAK